MDTIVLSDAAKALLEGQQAASLAAIVTEAAAPGDLSQAEQSAPAAELTNALEGALVQEALSGTIPAGSAETGAPLPARATPATAEPPAILAATTETPEVQFETAAGTAQENGEAAPLLQTELSAATYAAASTNYPGAALATSQTIPLTNAYAFAAAALVGVELGPRRRQDRQAARLKRRALRTQPLSAGQEIGEDIWHAILRMNA
jgi:hypothetical protein